MDTSSQQDFDWIIVGSGFGGSVSALRLAEKGYSVCVLECGKRFEDDDFAKSTLRNANRYYWFPFIKLKGIFRLTFFRDITVLSGCGVGGGSLGYANTLYRARDKFFADKQWAQLADWKQELAPHYDTAEYMLGVTEVPVNGPTDDLIRNLAKDMGVEDTYTKTRVGVYFGKSGETVKDPYFGGEGPDRTGCHFCGACMVGCQHGAKNTLVKNYLWFAEKLGVRIIPERTVVDVRPLPGTGGELDGSGGYEVETVTSGAWFRKHRKVQRAGGVIVAAGALGTNKLLQNCKYKGSLPRVSDQLGELVRTNSEAILAVTSKNDDVDWTESVAISSSFYPDENTHIENTVYGHKASSMGAAFVLLTGEGSRVTRPLRFIASAVRHPIKFARTLWPYHWSRRTVILLVMQTLDNSIAFKPKKKLFGKGVKLTSEEDPLKPNPKFIPVANETAARAAEMMDGTPQSSFAEALFNMPTTAHILGGAVIAADPAHGVVDTHNRVFGYQNMLICDGAAMPSNPGVNPSLTITALAEHAMAAVPDKSQLHAPIVAEQKAVAYT
ncbi:MAG: GMC family oxidoreductase [Thermoleophilaceae bacterium]|nr:GMC family oxidoreductase [Thermoleophilaceae bacterium]